ncbi:MAG: SUMF1/EgtB/PvdO family nonheme iron enzyme [Candidatus Anammoxibacter sp.]
MKKYFCFCLAIIIQLSFILVQAKGAESIGKGSSDTLQTQVEDHSVNQKKCPKCGRVYPAEMVFCGIDKKKLREIKREPQKIDILPEVTDNDEVTADAKKSNAAKFEAFKKAMEYIKSGDMFRKERNDFVLAAEEYEKAVKLTPDNLPLHYKLAGAYWKLGNKKNALEHLDRCKELYPKGSPGITQIDKYIKKLERVLNVEEKTKRREISGVRISKVLSEALEQHRDKWSAMVLVPEGKFIMGSKDDEFNIEEMPQHEVYLSPYYIDKFEVANALYGEFLDYMNKTNDHSKCYFGEGQKKNHTPDRWHDDSYYEHAEWPVVRVDWYDAYAFAAWAGKRLPTEAEWEKAARGTDARRFPWGNVWESSNCNAGKDGSLEVGSYENGKSVYGVYDMCGSVQEWCNDWHHAMYYASSPSRNPQGPVESTNLRTMRGSSLFANNVYQMRTTIRWYDEPHRRNRSVGFRCAKDYAADKE